MLIVYLNQVLIGHFSNSVFRQSANDIKMKFRLNMCISMEFNFNAFSEKIFHITDFWVRNAKINFFEEKCVYCAAFIKLKYMQFHTGLVH